ncbi:hypothetical protein EP7_001734 [Isosphaeraceae bacterium EP7]
MSPGRELDGFAGLVAGLSGREAGPAADNLVSNEDSYPRVAGELASAGLAGSVYLGVGPDQNFSMIAACRPSWAFIVDRRRGNTLVHLLHKGLFTLADDRVGYLQRLTARAGLAVGAGATGSELVAAFSGPEMERGRLDRAILDVAGVLRGLGVLAGRDEFEAVARIQARLAGPGMAARFLALPMYPTLGRLIGTADRGGKPGHFLGTEAGYVTVRDLQRADRCVPLVGDYSAADTLPRLAAWLRSRGLKVGVLYISDVEFFLLRAGQFKAYLANLSAMPWAPGALIVRTSTREIGHPERVAGDSSTTIARPVSAFLVEAHAGRIEAVDDLFR